MNVNLRQLRSLVTIARRGSFTRAARDLHLSQPALTVQMRQLEDALGVRLLDRNTRAVKLTALGQQILPIFERALGDIDMAVASTRLSEASIGLVSVAALPSMCSTLLPEAMAKFAIQYPGIAVRLREAGARRLSVLVVEEEVEFGIGIVEHPHPQLETIPFLTDHLVAVVPSGHALSKRRSIAPADLAPYPMIALETQYSVRSLSDAVLRAASAAKPPAHEVAFISTAIGMVRAGLGITVVSTSSLSRVAMDGLVACRISRSGLSREIAVVSKRGRTLSPAACSLLRSITSARDDAGWHKPRRSRAP